MAHMFLKRIAVFFLLFYMAAVCVPVSAKTACADNYQYEIKIYTGQQGKYADGTTVKPYTVSYGGEIEFKNSSVRVIDGDRYYVKGIRKAGEDNSKYIPNMKFAATEDADYVVAYGIMSSAVKYTVHYRDAAGNQLAEDDEYYGNIGDKPVATYKYIKDYVPKYRAITGTLKDPSTGIVNEWTFEYYKETPAASTQNAAAAAQNGRNAQQQTNNTQNNAQNNTTGNGENPLANIPPEDINPLFRDDGTEEILDMDVPQGRPESIIKFPVKAPIIKQPSSIIINKWIIVLCVVLFFAIVLLLEYFLLFKRRKDRWKRYYEESED